MKTKMQQLIFATAIAVSLVVAVAGNGCGKHEHAEKGASGHGGHAHQAPHGGTLIELGEEAYHLELVLQPASGLLEAYVLDGHAENFVRIAQPTLELELKRGSQNLALSLAAIANPATGETVGDTALFALIAPDLRNVERFDGVVKSITIRGNQFANVAFRFPEGSEGH